MGKTKLISLEDLSFEELEVDAELIPLMTTEFSLYMEKKYLKKQLHQHQTQLSQCRFLALQRNVHLPQTINYKPNNEYSISCLQ